MRRLDGNVNTWRTRRTDRVVTFSVCLTRRTTTIMIWLHWFDDLRCWLAKDCATISTAFRHSSVNLCRRVSQQLCTGSRSYWSMTGSCGERRSSLPDWRSADAVICASHTNRKMIINEREISQPTYSHIKDLSRPIKTDGEKCLIVEELRGKNTHRNREWVLVFFLSNSIL